VRAAAQERHVPALILRLGQVWSEDGQLITPAVGIRAGRPAHPRRRPIDSVTADHVDDAVEAMVQATRSAFADGRIYHVVGDDSLTREELATLYARRREPHLRIIQLPMGLACALAEGSSGSAISWGGPLDRPYRLRSAYVPLPSTAARRARSSAGDRA